MPSLGREAVNTQPAASQDSETTYELKNFATRESKKHGADVFTGYPRNLRIPCRANGRYFTYEGDYCYFKSKASNTKFQRTFKKKGNLTLSKDRNYLIVTQLKEMEISDLPHQELKIAILKELNELHESTERQFKKVGETIHTHLH